MKRFHRYHDGSPCENVRWRKSALEEIVFEALKRQIEIVSIESAAVASIYSIPIPWLKP